jgi:hypothetical protein
MGVSVRSRDLPYLRFPGAIRALGLQTTHIWLRYFVMGWPRANTPRKFACKFFRVVGRPEVILAELARGRRAQTPPIRFRMYIG